MKGFYTDADIHLEKQKAKNNQDNSEEYSWGTRRVRGQDVEQFTPL